VLNAIETAYNGYRFRSRLEARWAVFFDSLGVRYEYEREGFDLGSAGWYLPDFWLPKPGCWVEIKGSDPTGEEIAKAKALALASKQVVWVFAGPPNYSPEDDWLYTEYRINATAYYFDELPDWYAEAATNDPEEYGGTVAVRQNIAQGGIVWKAQWSPFSGSESASVLWPFKCSEAEYRQAFHAARGARF
jgi:hypothetical protein